VRDRRHEVALLLLETPLGGEVPERVHDAGGAPDRDERQPEIVPADVEWERDRACGLAATRDGDLVREEGPRRDDVGEAFVADGVRREPRDSSGGAVPEPHDAFVVEEEDPVADRVEDVRRLLAFFCDRARRCLGGLQAPALLLQPRVPYGDSHLRDERLHELELLGRVLAAVAHHLHDADDATLVLDGHHHRRGRPGRTGFGYPLDRPLAVDVVVHAAHLFDALLDVVEHERLAAEDDAALHPAARAVQRQRR
jgi:hypothetical protein